MARNRYVVSLVLLTVFRDLPLNQYSWSHRAGHHRQLSCQPDRRRISRLRFFQE